MLCKDVSHSQMTFKEACSPEHQPQHLSPSTIQTILTLKVPKLTQQEILTIVTPL